MKNKKLWVSIMAGFLAALMLLSLLSGLFVPVGAASSSELKKQLEELKAKDKENKEKLEALEDQLKDNVKDIQELVGQKDIIDQQVFALYEQMTNIQDQIATYNVLIADKQEELDAAQARYDELSRQNKDRIRAMEEDGKLSYWSVLFKANSFSDLLDRLNMVEEIAAADYRRLQELDEAANKVKEARQALQEEKESLEATQKELEATQKELEAKQEKAENLLADLIAKGAEYEALVEEGEEEQSRLAQEIAKTEKEYDKAKYQEWLATYVPPTTKPKPTNSSNSSNSGTGSNSSSGSGSNSGSSTPSSSGWRYPLPSRVGVSSPYGMRLHPVDNVWKMHHGIDLNASKGTAIKAARSGKVTRATYDSASGYYVSINHGDGFSSSYLHMTHYIVKAGDYVEAGQTIGYVGSTGKSTGPHLHFAIYYNGSSVNPAKYINF